MVCFHSFPLISGFLLYASRPDGLWQTRLGNFPFLLFPDYHPWAALGTPGYLSESGAGWRNEIQLRRDREMPETIYLVSLEKRRQQRWGGKTASRLVQKRLLASSWKGENKQHFSGLNKKRPKASFIGPIRATACGRECSILIWVLTEIFAGLRNHVTWTGATINNVPGKAGGVSFVSS